MTSAHVGCLTVREAMHPGIVSDLDVLAALAQPGSATTAAELDVARVLGSGDRVTRHP